MNILIKAEFSASLLQSSVSHDPSEIIIIYWFNAENSCAAQRFCGNRDSFFLDTDEYNVQKNIFCNIINVFTVTFDQFNVSLLNKSINFLTLLTPNIWS